MVRFCCEDLEVFGVGGVSVSGDGRLLRVV